LFKAKTTTCVEWKAIASTISTLVEEATFEVNADGLSFRAMDPSHVALVDLQWSAKGFATFECDKQSKFSIRVEDFVKLMRRADAKDSIEISAKEDEVLNLVISNGYKRHYKLTLLESSAAPTPLPKLNFNVKMVMPEKTLERVLSDVSVVSDHATIEALSNSVVFQGKSDMGTALATLEKGNEDLIELEVKEENKATYSINYLTNMVKAIGSASEVVTIEYSTKMPVRLEFKIGSGEGRIHFYLAPRIEEN